MNDTITLPYKSYNHLWLNLQNVFEDLYNSNPSEININFSKVSFMEPFHLVVLASFLDKFYKDEIRINFVNLTDKLINYLNSIKYIEYFDISKERPPFNVFLNDSIPIWNISKKETHSYSNYAKEIFQRKFASNKDLIIIQSNLDEIFNNIFDHSDSKTPGYVFSQYFPYLKQVKFCVADLGVGIPYKINEYLNNKNEPPISDYEAILKSTELHVTSQSTPRNRGRGLNNIIDLCNNNLGIVSIYSNRGRIIKNNDNITKNDFNINFSGTILNIIININETHDFEEDTQIFNFDI